MIIDGQSISALQVLLHTSFVLRLAAEFRIISRLVMFGSQRQLSVSSLAAFILRLTCHFATLLGIVCFRVKRDRCDDGRLVARDRKWFKWCSLLLRLGLCFNYVYFYMGFFSALSLNHLKVLICTRLLCSVICALVIVVMQFCYGQQLLCLVNGFIDLFRRVNALPGCHDMHYGGRRELCLLILGVVCHVYQVCYLIPTMFDDPSLSYVFSVFCETFSSLSSSMICHICFVAYLSVGALYDQMNRYVQEELREQLLALEQQRQSGGVNRRQLRSAAFRLDECLILYEDIHQIGDNFGRLFDIPLCFVLLFGFITMALGAFFFVASEFNGLGTLVFEFKLLMDLMLLTLAIHGAGSSSRVVRSLSLDNYYVTDSKKWHIKVGSIKTCTIYSTICTIEERVEKKCGMIDEETELQNKGTASMKFDNRVCYLAIPKSEIL